MRIVLVEPSLPRMYPELVDCRRVLVAYAARTRFNATALKNTPTSARRR